MLTTAFLTFSSSVEQRYVDLCSIIILIMRAALRLLADVKPGRFLEADNPTGLTGLFTHPSPRLALIGLYNETLDRLGTLPEHSVYRKSAEAITSHRLDIVKSVKPEGYEEWVKATREKIEEHPELFQRLARTDIGNSKPDGSIISRKVVTTETNEREVERNGERVMATPEGLRTKDEKANLRSLSLTEFFLGARSKKYTLKPVPEPPLEATQ